MRYAVIRYVCVAKQKTVMPMQWSKVWYCAVWHCKVYLCYNRQTGRQWHPCSGVRYDIVRYVCVTTGKPEDSDAHAVEQGSQCRVHQRHSLAAAQRWIHHQKHGCESGDGWSCSVSDCTPLVLLFSLSGVGGCGFTHSCGRLSLVVLCLGFYLDVPFVLGWSLNIKNWDACLTGVWNLIVVLLWQRS